MENKKKFIRKWSSLWSCRKESKQLDVAFAKELNEVIYNEILKRESKIEHDPEHELSDLEQGLANQIYRQK